MFLRSLFVLLSCLFVSGCGQMGHVVKGSGKITKDERHVEPFNKVVVSGVGNLLVQTGDIPSVVVEGDDNLLEYIRTQVSEGVLYIETLNNVSLSPTKDLVYHVTVPNPSSITVSGAATVKSVKQIKSDDLKVVLSGAGSVSLDIDTHELIVDLSGSGNILLIGKADKQEINVSGAGIYKGFGLESKKGKVIVSGVGSAEVNIIDDLDVEISGVGSLNYRGAPKIKQTISGVGTVRHVE